MDKTGYIYVLTNESFHRDNWIKIGYAEDVEKRVKQLSGTAVPLPYEVYCTYEIPRIERVKDPDKLIHDIISRINPDLRITENREFFEMYPWDAYGMLFAIAQIHGRTDKLIKNKDNSADKDSQCNSEYSLDNIFPANSETRNLYEKMKTLILSIDDSLEEVITLNYVTYKKGKKNSVALWHRTKCIEVVLNARIGQIKDDSGLLYDISNRGWSTAQYAFKFYDDTDLGAVTDLLKQVISLKR